MMIPETDLEELSELELSRNYTNKLMFLTLIIGRGHGMTFELNVLLHSCQRSEISIVV